ncbi:hypothetical protein B0H19DRAFT_1125065 [Mycena capillaripes]|nr:hypothetical protein B0H19DRAFT_1125065 [Mycena capillaripes]
MLFDSRLGTTQYPEHRPCTSPRAMLSVFRDPVYRAILNRSPSFSTEVLASLDLTSPVAASKVMANPVKYIYIYKVLSAISLPSSSSVIMLVVHLFFLAIGFATAFPVLSTELAPKNSVSISSAQDESVVHEIFDARARPSRHGNQIFASAQWERSLPSGVREARDPLSTNFNHIQWENLDLDDTSPRSTSQIFAHAQWEEQEIHQEEDENIPSTRARREDVQNFDYQQLERRDSESQAVGRREDISTGPVFFAHIQWEEEE